MSSMLEQAIIDAKALKESAIKNAEAMVIEKYADQIKEAVDSLLEQPEEDFFDDEEELDLEAGEEEADPSLDQIPPATAEDLPSPGQPANDLDVITFDLPDLVQAIEDVEEEEGVLPQPEESHEELAADLGAAVEASPEVTSPLSEDENVEFDIDDALLEELMERLKVDINPQKSGWAGTPESIMQEYEAMLLAREADDDVQEENEALRKRVEELEESLKDSKTSHKKLIKENEKYMEVVMIMKEKIESVNVSNAKLLYINQALENSSLNERQRRKIVEAISKAETTQEAKVIYETLQSTVGSTERKPLPKSLSEAVNRNSSLIVSSHRNNKEQKSTNVFSERMQRLAGIKKN